ncbi:carbohydrate binding family 9 domain-containing protein [Corallococcus terminator]|uniref:DUF5916 domain-containing protein n=1 Tax=Corallococcus terminator TaxID=2316733 RepID=A0A3A8HYM7_9BACT|nr:carbohydrate binding family 9 domain-containing protein [Corallococcus terminator]RKG75476.1 hypothetical protein D7V88_33435 [Corallococcus terminator]
MKRAVRFGGGWLAGLWLALAVPAQAAEGPRVPAVFRAARTQVAVAVDGVLDEPAWAAAPVYSDFVQSFPTPGAEPGERTEVRILHDERNLYVGITAFDRQPALIRRSLGRRDAIPPSDMVTVMVDTLRDRATAYLFSINAGGTLEDARLTEDTTEAKDWDAVWEGEATVTQEGWTAELRVPLSVLRFPEALVQTWGFHVRRQMARTHEQVDSTVIPREANALVSRFADFQGLEGVHHQRGLMLTPYVASRLTASRTEVPLGGVSSVEPSADVGLDFQAALASDLSLTGTFNPDFGQVEADELLVNLSTSEVFFPEKRPFFLEGLELFQPVGAQAGRSAQTLFYSRRVGLDQPLLGAVKLVGTVSDGVQVGLLNAVSLGAPALGNAPARGYRFQWARPLHFASQATLPRVVPPPMNSLAGVLRAEVAQGQQLGLMVTAASPLSSKCQGTPLPDDPPCVVRGGQAAAADFRLRTADGVFAVSGQVDASRVTGGGPEGLLLRDGTLLRPGDLGFGAYLRGGKLGGEPWRTTLTYEYESPTLDLNASGFQPLQNQQKVSAHVQYGRGSRWGIFPELWLGVRVQGGWSTDARGLPLSRGLDLTLEGVLPDFSTLFCDAGVETDRRDLREIPGRGLAYELPDFGYLTCGLETDPLRPLALKLEGYVDRTTRNGPSPGRVGKALSAGVSWRPMPRLQTDVDVSYEATQDGPRWTGETEDGRLLFAELVPRFLTLTFKQLVVVTPRLTLQARVQLLTGLGPYGPFYAARIPEDGTVRLRDLQPVTDVEDPSFHTAALNVNVVARWEYHVGSTLYFIYSRAQEEPLLEGADAGRRSLGPQGLGLGPRSDTVLLKASYAW